MSMLTPGMGGGSGSAIAITSTAAGVIIPQTPVFHSILPQTGGSNTEVLLVTAATTFVVMLISHAVMRSLRFVASRRA